MPQPMGATQYRLPGSPMYEELRDIIYPLSLYIQNLENTRSLPTVLRRSLFRSLDVTQLPEVRNGAF